LLARSPVFRGRRHHRLSQLPENLLWELENDALGLGEAMGRGRDACAEPYPSANTAGVTYILQIITGTDGRTAQVKAFDIEAPQHTSFRRFPVPRTSPLRGCHAADGGTTWQEVATVHPGGFKGMGGSPPTTV
jgi:hypothetical protein